MEFTDRLPGVYSGGAFNNGLPNGKASGTLRADSDALRFEYEGGKAELPLSGLKAAFGGAANRLIFFTHPEKPEWTFFTAERGILQDSTLNFAYGLGEQLARLRGSRRMTVAVWLGVLGAIAALIVALILGIVFNRDAMIDSVTRQIPPEAEKALGDQVLKQVQASSKMVEDPAVLALLKDAAAPLMAVPGAGHEFHLYIVEDAQVNAFALPGGHIVFTTGLLLEAGSSEEVMGVLAHEMAHSVKRHNMRQLVATVGLGLLLQAFVGDSTGLIAVLAGVGGMLAKNGYSRDQEREADRLGAGYLIKAHIDPHALLEFMQRQQQKLHKAGVGEFEGQLSYLSTHPSFEERIAMLSEKREGPPLEEVFVKVNLDYEAFKAKLRETLAKH
jgi:predicted Zn-dependent protease